LTVIRRGSNAQSPPIHAGVDSVIFDGSGGTKKSRRGDWHGTGLQVSSEAFVMCYQFWSSD